MELNRLNEELHDKGLSEFSLGKKRAGKKAYVKCLVEARRALRKYSNENGGDWEAEVTADITERYEGTMDKPIEVIEEEVEDPFFTFEGTDARADAIQNQKVTFTKERNSYAIEGRTDESFSVDFHQENIDALINWE